MGACCSMPESEVGDHTNHGHQNRGVVPRTSNLELPPLSKACYSDYLCHVCGRYWNSTLSWYNCTQQCKHCFTDVPPRNQRPVRPEDIKKTKGNEGEHSMELCQKCRELGYHCGIYNQRVKQVQAGGRRGRGRVRGESRRRY